LRTNRILEEGICITVEPGLYFIDFMIKRGLENPETAPYLNVEKIE
jgi:Xaa-Pro dipeptidase